MILLFELASSSPQADSESSVSIREIRGSLSKSLRHTDARSRQGVM